MAHGPAKAAMDIDLSGKFAIVTDAGQTIFVDGGSTLPWVRHPHRNLREWHLPRRGSLA